ncbi:hypothetical protein MMD27_004356 [Acinetobacter baumannii]|nr:hypothetical protein [Acinetobacter baumannii]EKU3445967.1 hypothetical protein [Acinetobacter baumannii]
MKSNTNQELYNELLREGKIFATNIKPPYGNNIHNEYLSNPFYDPNNRAFNIYYLNSNEFVDQIRKNPLYLGYIPPQIFNENDIWDLINANPISIINLDDSYIQPNMYATAVMIEPRLLGLLNESHQTVDVVSEVIKKVPMALQYVRDDLKFFYICQKAVSLDWRAIEFVPPNIIDSKLIEIASKDEDAFLLDKVDRSKLDADFYVDQLMRFPIEGATHVIAANLVNNEQRINELMYFIENLNAYAPQFIFDNCDPKILMHHEKYDALVYMLSQRPQWIEYLKPRFITKEIFEIALNNGIYPKLESINWTGDLIASAFNLNKRAYVNLPVDRVNAVGVERLTQTIVEAIQNGWVDELPKYVFIDEVVNNLDLRPDLIGQRPELAYLVTQAHNIEWDRVLNLDCSVAEMRLLNDPIPTELAAEFFDRYVESYVALADKDKTLERTEIFLKKYPNEIRSLPKTMQQNYSMMRNLLTGNPLLGRYLQKEEIMDIFAT